ncbi:MAG: cyclic nucleotide-binding domain-containing protein [Acidimicrobiales bacterium]
MTRSRFHAAALDGLGRIDAFRECSRKELAAVDRLTTETSVPDGAVLCREGGLGQESFVIVDGEATVTVNGIEVARVGPGTFCGEMALLEHGVRCATVTAEMPMRVLVLSIREFDELLAAAPTVTQRMLAELSSRLRTADHHVAAV